VRNATSQQVFDLFINKLSQNWNLNPLSAISEVNDLRSIDLDDIGMDFECYLTYIFECKENVSIVQTLMIEERNWRLKGKGQYKEKDKWLKDDDLKAIYECHYRGQFQALQGKGSVIHKDDNPQGQRRKTNQYHVHADQYQMNIPST